MPSGFDLPPESEAWAEQAQAFGVRLRWNNNRRQLLTLRARSPQAQPVLSVHYRMPQYGLQFEDLIDWLRGGQLPAKVREIFATWDANRSLTPQQATSVSAPPLRQDWPLAAVGQAVAARWFADLSPVTFSWSRGSKGALRSIRLGSYRSQPQPAIRLHPRLAQPHVPAVLVEYIVFHELCHHRQFCEPLQQAGRWAGLGSRRAVREMPHSPRFQAWEAEYPLFAQARRIERLWGAALRDPRQYENLTQHAPSADAPKSAELMPVALTDFMEEP